MDTNTVSVWEKYKDQFQLLTNALKSNDPTQVALLDDNKDFTFELKGGDPTGGFRFNLRFAKEEDYNKFITEPKDYMENVDTISIISFDAKNAEGVSLMGSLFEAVKPFITLALKAESYLRIEGTRVFIDIPHLNNNGIAGFLNTGINTSGFQDFIISLSSHITATDFFNLSFNDFIEKLLNMKVLINQKFFNVSNVLKKLIEVGETLEIPEYQDIVAIAFEIVKIISMVITAELKLEFSPKDLVDVALTSSLIMEIGGKEILESGFEQLKMSGDMLKAMVQDQQMLTALGIIDLESIRMITVFPKYKMGSLYELDFPGLNQVAEEKILN